MADLTQMQRNMPATPVDDAGRILPVEDNAAAPTPIVGIPAMGTYTVSSPNYTDGDSGVLHLDSDGNLMTAVNIFKLSGNAISTDNGTSDSGTMRVTVASDSTGQIQITDGTSNLIIATPNTAPSNGFQIYGMDEDGKSRELFVSKVTDRLWVDALCTVSDGTNSLPLQVDNTVATQIGVAMFGVYNATLVPYNDTDAAMLQTDVLGRLRVTTHAGTSFSQGAMIGSLTTGDNDTTLTLNGSTANALKKIVVVVPGGVGDLQVQFYDNTPPTTPISGPLYLNAQPSDGFDMTEVDVTSGTLGVRVNGWLEGMDKAYITVSYLYI